MKLECPVCAADLTDELSDNDGNTRCPDCQSLIRRSTGDIVGVSQGTAEMQSAGKDDELDIDFDMLLDDTAEPDAAAPSIPASTATNPIGLSMDSADGSSHVGSTSQDDATPEEIDLDWLSTEEPEPDFADDLEPASVDSSGTPPWHKSISDDLPDATVTMAGAEAGSEQPDDLPPSPPPKQPFDMEPTEITPAKKPRRSLLQQLTGGILLFLGLAAGISLLQLVLWWGLGMDPLKVTFMLPKSMQWVAPYKLTEDGQRAMARGPIRREQPEDTAEIPTEDGAPDAIATANPDDLSGEDIGEDAPSPTSPETDESTDEAMPAETPTDDATIPADAPTESGEATTGADDSGSLPEPGAVDDGSSTVAPAAPLEEPPPTEDDAFGTDPSASDGPLSEAPMEEGSFEEGALEEESEESSGFDGGEATDPLAEAPLGTDAAGSVPEPAADDPFTATPDGADDLSNPLDDVAADVTDAAPSTDDPANAPSEETPSADVDDLFSTPESETPPPGESESDAQPDDAGARLLPQGLPTWEPADLVEAVDLADRLTQRLNEAKQQRQSADQLREVAREFYRSFCQLGEIAAVADPASATAELGRTRALLQELAEDGSKLRMIGTTSVGWLQAELGVGLLTAGTIDETATEGDYEIIKIRPVGKTATLVFIRPAMSADPDRYVAERGREVVVLGRTLSDLPSQLPAYTGTESSLIWCEGLVVPAN